MTEPYCWEDLPRDGDYVRVSVCLEDECITDEPMGVRVGTTSWGSSWMDVKRAQSFSAALEQAIIHASGDPIQGALARIRGALETLREAGMGEMGEAYVIDALAKMGVDTSVAATVDAIDKIVLQEVEDDGGAALRVNSCVHIGDTVYALSSRIAIEIQMLPTAFAPLHVSNRSRLNSLMTSAGHTGERAAEMDGNDATWIASWFHGQGDASGGRDDDTE